MNGHTPWSKVKEGRALSHLNDQIDNITKMALQIIEERDQLREENHQLREAMNFCSGSCHGHLRQIQERSENAQAGTDSGSEPSPGPTGHATDS